MRNQRTFLVLIFLMLNCSCSFKALISELNSSTNQKTEPTQNQEALTLILDNTEDDSARLSLSGSNLQDLSVGYVIGLSAVSDCSTLTPATLNTSTGEISLQGLSENSDYTVAVCRNSDIKNTLSIHTKSYCASKNRMTNSPFANSNEPNVDGMADSAPFTLCTATQLNNIASVPANLNKYYQLKADIDLSTLTANSYNIIAAVGIFTGSFDGNNFKIKNLTYSNNAQNCVALICNANLATVKNLTLENFNLTGRDYTAALAGNFDLGTVTNVKSSGIINGRYPVGGLIADSEADISYSSSSATVTASSGNAGGLVGNHNAGNITRCFATGNVSAPNSAGGLTSGSYGGIISESYATGNVTATVSNIAGGLVGSLWTTMSKVYATGNVSGRDYVGGLVGDYAASDVSDCYSTGNVTGRAWVGGLVGHFYSNSLNRCYSSGNVVGTGQQVGSLIGYYQAGNASNSFAIGNVTGVSVSNYVGLLYGQYSSGVRTNLYYNSSASCTNSSGTCTVFGTGVALGSSFNYFFDSSNAPLNTWDFTNVWRTSGTSLPTLRGF